MRIRETTLAGHFELFPEKKADERGYFVKFFHEEQFAGLGLATNFRETYVTYSVKNVLRGMHFQAPPADQAKIVTCLKGAALDVVVDIRRGSPTYGKHAIVELRADSGNMVYISAGFAHGFYVHGDEALLLYQAETVYSPQNDSGIKWDGCGIQWPSAAPILSARDRSFVALNKFESPFR
jgi:dTDP-4-dehydrorhamnose 3,5-epimerase